MGNLVTRFRDELKSVDYRETGRGEDNESRTVFSHHFIGWGFGVSFFLGCAKKTTLLGDSLVDKNWGRSYETCKYEQILNPDTHRNTEIVTGLDGDAASQAFGRYRRSFGGSEGKKEVYNLNLSTISGVGSK